MTTAGSQGRQTYVLYVCPACGWWEGDANLIGMPMCNGLWLDDDGPTHPPFAMDRLVVVALDTPSPPEVSS